MCQRTVIANEIVPKLDREATKIKISRRTPTICVAVTGMSQSHSFLQPPPTRFVAQLTANCASPRAYGRDVFADGETRDGDGYEMDAGDGSEEKSVGNEAKVNLGNLARRTCDECCQTGAGGSLRGGENVVLRLEGGRRSDSQVPQHRIHWVFGVSEALHQGWADLRQLPLSVRAGR